MTNPSLGLTDACEVGGARSSETPFFQQDGVSPFADGIA